MKLAPNKLASAVALLALYGVSAALLFRLLPGPHEHFEYMVIGTGSAGVTMLALFAGVVVKPRL